MSTTTPDSHIEKILCPNCDYIQEAKVLHTIPFGTYIHHCEKCNYTIMESEWNKYEPPTPTKARSSFTPARTGGYEILQCSVCLQKFNGGMGENGPGRRLARCQAKEMFDAHTCSITTPTKEVTAMQELIDWIDENKSHCTYGTIKQKAKSLLPKETEQIVRAYNKGWQQANNNPKPTYGTDYFNSKYNNQ